jgi:1-acyl-sn-glycerol-3-phosphate acyltransferase
MKWHQRILRHGLSIASSLWFFSNLGFWLVLLIAITPFKAVPFSGFQRHVITPLAHTLYRLAVRINSFWMRQVVGIELMVEGEIPSHHNPIVISNHQSWFDIPLVQDVISARGPILQFLIKRELVWVPIIGWICLVLNFPRLKRSGSADARAYDLAAINHAANELERRPGALFIFAEGTRFTPAKSATQASPYLGLLRPKISGFSAIVKQAPPDTPIIDLTLSYAAGSAHFWRCLHGGTPSVRIKVDVFQASEVTDVANWLDRRWRAKSDWLQAQIAQS